MTEQFPGRPLTVTDGTDERRRTTTLKVISASEPIVTPESLADSFADYYREQGIFEDVNEECPGLTTEQALTNVRRSAWLVCRSSIELVRILHRTPTSSEIIDHARLQLRPDELIDNAQCMPASVLTFIETASYTLDQPDGLQRIIRDTETVERRQLITNLASLMRQLAGQQGEQ